MRDDERTLIDQALRGEREAFDELIRRYQDAIYNYCRYCLGGRGEATDATQETFVQAYLNIRKYDARYAFYTWLTAIARNICRKIRRSENRHPAAGNSGERIDMPAPESPDGLPDELTSALRKGLSTLSDDQREAVLLRAMDDRSIAEIARAMEKSEGNVKVILFRAFEKLREFLGTKEWIL